MIRIRKQYLNADFLFRTVKQHSKYTFHHNNNHKVEDDDCLSSFHTYNWNEHYKV